MVELVVAMAILAILLGIGVPSFREYLANSKQVGAYNSVAKGLRLARSESIKRSSPTVVCARSTDTACGDDWSKGVLVFLDPESGAEAKVDDNEDILMVSAFEKGVLTISANATERPEGLTSHSYIRFSPRGRANWTLGTVVFCDERGDKRARAMVVSGSGLLRRSFSTPTSDEIEVDAFGDPVSC